MPPRRRTTLPPITKVKKGLTRKYEPLDARVQLAPFLADPTPANAPRFTFAGDDEYMAKRLGGAVHAVRFALLPEALAVLEATSAAYGVDGDGVVDALLGAPLAKPKRDAQKFISSCVHRRRRRDSPIDDSSIPHATPTPRTVSSYGRALDR